MFTLNISHAGENEKYQTFFEGYLYAILVELGPALGNN